MKGEVECDVHHWELSDLGMYTHYTYSYYSALVLLMYD